MNALIAAALGAGTGLGVLLIIAGLRGQQVLPPITRLVPGQSRTETAVAWLGAAVVAGLGVYAVIGWPIAGLLVAGAVLWLPRQLAGRDERVIHVARTEAIATWTEMVRDNMAGAAGLEQALLASATVAPAAIAPELRRFASRVERMPLIDALGRLGQDLDHPSADMVVVALANAVRLEAGDLGPLLGRLADTIRSDVRMRLRIEVGRTRIRTSARIVIATVAVTIGFLFLFARQLLDAYDSTVGQLWLALVASVFALGGWMLHNYSRVEMPERFTARLTQGASR